MLDIRLREILLAEWVNNMIGQERNLEMIFNWRMKKAIPRFIVITGEKGSGRLTLSKEIASLITCTPVIIGNTVDEVRTVIESSYSVKDTTLYIFRDADRMRNEAKNALLKVTEEPPNNAYFIMILTSLENTLDTIRSRSAHIQMESYSKKDIQEALKNDYFCTNDCSEMLDYCENIGQMLYWKDRGDLSEFVDFCKLTIENIDKVTGGNAFKIANKLKLKEKDEKGYDPIFFIKTVYKMFTQDKYFPEISKCCIDTIGKLQMVSAKKQSIVDMWILDIRNILMEE